MCVLMNQKIKDGLKEVLMFEKKPNLHRGAEGFLVVVLVVVLVGVGLGKS